MALDRDEPSPSTIAAFALMEAQLGAMERYWRLAVDTSDYQKRLKAAGFLDYPISLGVSEATQLRKYLVPKIAAQHHDEALFERWDAWEKEYEQINQASPKWRLKAMIRDVSESHACLSWPTRWERDIWLWAMAEGKDTPCPFDNRNGVIDEDFRARMRGLIQECHGFLYRCEETGQIVFAPTDELPRIWKHQDHLARIARDKPFGFFHDMSRPNWREYSVALTDVEQHMLSVIRRPRGLRGHLRALAQRLRTPF
jgi:hypothetical protein